MCGRFVLFTTGDELLDAVGTLPGAGTVDAPDGTPPARYNIAPTQQVPLVHFQEQGALIDAARWGLLPSWKKTKRGRRCSTPALRPWPKNPRSAPPSSRAAA